MPAPIALFVYNRPDHTLKTIEALSKNKGASESLIYVFCDGPKSDASLDEIKKIEETRELFDHLKGFKKVEIIKQPKNKGLADSIVDGVTEILRIHASIIVLEDDIVTSPAFLEYMNWALDEYQREERVMHVSGYWFPVSQFSKLPELFFLNLATCWGWGTWTDSWQKFSRSKSETIDLLDKSKMEKFNLDGYGDFETQLKKNFDGTIKTWAIFWYLAIFLNNGLSLHPNFSFTNNIGHDMSGENSYLTDKYNWDNLNTRSRVNLSAPLELNSQAIGLLKEFYRKLYQPSLFERIQNKIIRLWE